LVRHSELKGVEVPAARAPSMIDEYPILAVAAAFAKAKRRCAGWKSCGSRKATGWKRWRAGLKLNGVKYEIEGDDLIVEGGAVPGGGVVSTHMDHRIAMSFSPWGWPAKSR
jgi:3-phosphoshikimate 1-carboxyvinyltransferase